MKGQVVADFLVDHSMVEMAQNYVDIVPWRLYFDGSRHKHGSGIGGVIISPDGIPVEFKYRIEGVCTNNEAEYESLITGLELLLELGARNVEIMGDSELVTKQIDGGKLMVAHICVYDIVFCGMSNSMVEHFVKQMKSEFEMSLVGELTYFLGLQLKKMEDIIFVSQRKYVKSIMKKFGLDNASHKRTLVVTHVKLIKDENGVDVDQS
ncbi:uncharacterized protein LOC127082420 [Lathyrus oleraceus]|uniref:uncharacterized protein LOC127082420 n=1 Tax=Pisum sativum TaxID=3888 RepID=UPI0021D0059E|nr:uncharacterized protein LOC127082420 [Pisum sativum]